MPPVVIDTIDEFRAGLLRAEQAQMAEAARRWLGVEQALQVQADALALELQRDGGRVTMGQLQRSRRWQELQRQVDAELGRYAGFLNGRIVDGQRNMMLNAISHSQATIQAIAAESEIVVQFNRLPVTAVENMIGLAGDGSPVRALLDEAAAAGPDAMAQELVNGIALGRNPLEVARRAIRQGLGQSFTRMATIARTEQLRVYRETTLQSYRASNVVMGYRRLSARDSRTCIACLFADGRYYELGESFDQHPNCIVGGTVVNSPSVLATSKRWFDGEVIEIRTVNGNVLTVTPNHPILTDKGWVAARLLKEGDNVISSLNGKRTILTADPDSDGGPSIIEDVVESFAGTGGMAAVSVPTATEDFHGDGGHGNVDIVRADGFLHDWRQSVIGQPLGELPFGFGGMRLHTFLTDSTFAEVFNRALFPAHGSMSSGGVSHSLFRASAGLQKPVGFGLPADFHAGFNQAQADYAAADSILGGDGILGFTGGIEADNFGNWHGYTPIMGWDSVPFQVTEQRSSADVVAGANNSVAIPVGVITDGIVNLTRRQFSGHVYNLQTSTGWYIAEGIITHNCRCTMIPVLRNVPPVEYETGQQWFRRQPESTQRAMMGRGRYEAWQAGGVTLDDMVSRDWDDVWGGNLRTTRVRDLAAGRGAVPTRRTPAPAPVAPRAVEWKPSLSRADADDWARNSVMKGDAYHVTSSVKNERSIMADGFDLSRVKFGRMWGDGVYVGTDESTATMYRGWTGPGARTMKIKVDVRNPAIFNAAGQPFRTDDVVSQVLGIDKKAAGALLYDKKTKSVIDLSTVLRNNGFDALDIRGANSALGGNQMVIFDPKKVVVIND